jgi:DNA (cytosine-5)-methyltransferase 1
MYELALFAGAGGGLLATQHLLGWRTVCYVERNAYCVDVLTARIQDGLLDNAPIWDDVRTFDGRPWRGVVDIVTAGFPCQPYSGVGKRLAECDDRNLWPDTIRVVREVRPQLVLLENVSRLLAYPYFGQILGDLSTSGFCVRWDCVPASAVGAPHRRDRVWILAYADHGGQPRQENIGESETRVQGRPHSDGSSEGARTMANADGNEQDGRGSIMQMGWERSAKETGSNDPILRNEWPPEPGMGRVANGVAHRVDRLAALGEGQVPAVVSAVWRMIGETML